MERQLVRQSETVADRQNVDVEGLRDRIVKAYAENPLWEKLSMSQKLRQLIEQALESIEKQQEGK